MVFTNTFLGVLSFALLFLSIMVNTGGTMWMLYVVVRHEERPLRYGLLGLVPFAFVWYYLARIRKMDILGTVPTNAGRPKPSGRVFVIAVVLYTILVMGLGFALDIVWNMNSALAFAIGFLPFIISAIGQMWMMYTAVRHEREPLLFFILAGFPLVFVWYYYFRVKAGKIESRHEPKLSHP